MKKLLLLAVPLVLFTVIWSIQWRRAHPPASAEDLNIEKLLRKADRMNVNGQIAAHEAVFEVKIAKFRREDFYSLTRDFRLGHAADDFKDTNLTSIIWFRFFKGDQELVAVSNANSKGDMVLEFSASNPQSKPKRLHRRTVQHFYQFLSSHPELIQQIEAAGG